MRKRRLKFYRHIKRTELSWITKQVIVEFHEDRRKAKTETKNGFPQLKKAIIIKITTTRLTNFNFYLI